MEDYQEYDYAMEQPKNHLSNLAYSVAIVFISTILFILSSLQLLHWFLFPVMVCGIIITVDAVKWFRGYYDLFDPKGILGILGFHFFFTAPILVVVWKIETVFTGSTLVDYRPWLGLIAFINIPGLMIYQFVEKKVSSAPYKSTAKMWRLNRSYGKFILMVFLLIALIAQIYFVGTRGFAGRVSYELKWELKGGTGIYRLLGYALPVLIMMFVTVCFKMKKKGQSSMVSTYSTLFVLLIIAFLLGGMAGSRSSTIWTLFSMVGITHFYWRKISVKQALVGAMILFTFMVYYGFYKKLGSKGLEIWRTEGFASAAQASGTSVQGTLISNYSRANIHAYMAYVLIDKPYHYKYRWGSTVWGDFISQFPVWIYPNYYNLTGSNGKMIAGTDIMRGAGVFDPYEPYSKARYVYGLAGQVMLNFGLLPIPLAYIVLGYCVGRFRRAFLNWDPNDLRFLIVPGITNFLFIILSSDLDNLFNFAIFRLSYPIIVLFLMSEKVFRWPYQSDEAGLQLPHEYY